MEFYSDSLRLEEDFSDENTINIEVSYYDESLDCKNETTIMLVKGDVVQMAKKLGVTSEDLV